MNKIVQLSLIFSLLTGSLHAGSVSPEENVSEINQNYASAYKNPSYLDIRKEKVPSIVPPIITGLIGLVFTGGVFINLRNMNDSKYLTNAVHTGYNLNVNQYNSEEDYLALFAQDNNRQSLTRDQAKDIIRKKIVKMFKAGVAVGIIVSAVCISFTAYKAFKYYKAKKQQELRKKLKTQYRETKALQAAA